MRELGFVKLLSRLENAGSLDPLTEKTKAVVDAIVRPRALRDVLHGVPFGHPVHPVAVMLPIGCWAGSAILDGLPGMDRASRSLIAAGLLGVGASAVTGFTDWSELHEQQKRVGIVHAGANVLASGFYAASWIRRGRGADDRGKILGLLGLTTVGVAGFIGGHLSYRQAAGANHAESVPHLFPTGWQDLGPLESLTPGEVTGVQVAGQSLVAVRHGQDVDVLFGLCSHLSAPLAEGHLRGEGADACIECPWHGSQFLFTSGDVAQGPATAPLPRFDTRVVDGMVQVCLPGTG